MRFRLSNRLILPFAVVLALATAQTATARVKKHRVERPAPPVVTLEHGTPIIMQGMTWPKTPAAGEVESRQRAERPRNIPRGSSGYVPPAPLPPRRLSQPSAIAPYQPPPINSLSDRVTGCIQSFPFNAGLGNNPTNRDFYVRSCVNN
jgi:hypothetical protein